MFDMKKYNIAQILCTKTFWDQAIGLMFKKDIPPDYGMLFVYKRPKIIGIHTFFMRFMINIIFFDEKMEEIKIVKNLKPWRVVYVKGVKAFLEVKGGELKTNV